jgi:hypothetical protein
MPSDALVDFRYRMQEPGDLLSQARLSMRPRDASMYTKCAIVLAAAALERYMNDVLEEACREIKESSWQDLSEGRQRYLLRHVAIKMAERAQLFVDKGHASPSDCAALVRFVEACREAVVDPSTWTYFSDFGLFGEGTNAPEKIDAVLRAFDAAGRGLYAFMEDRGAELPRVIPGLKQLVDARHGAAHALTGIEAPGPTDGEEWIGCASIVAEEVDVFLDFASRNT